MSGNPILAFWHSTIGKKVVMAVTGFVLVGFVVVHMVGNLKIYFGAEKFDHYAEFLRTVGYPVLFHGQALWIFRIVLLVCVGLHATAAIQLWLRSKTARPVGYQRWEPVESTYAARTIRWGGLIVALFVIYHILHFTVGRLGYTPGAFQEGFPYRNVVRGFQVWYVSSFYMLAMVAVGLHLYHGIWSMFQTVGWNDSRFHGLWRGIALLIALAVVVGNVSIPVAVLAGLVK